MVPSVDLWDVQYLSQLYCVCAHSGREFLLLIHVGYSYRPSLLAKKDSKAIEQLQFDSSSSIPVCSTAVKCCVYILNFVLQTLKLQLCIIMEKKM